MRVADDRDTDHIAIVVQRLADQTDDQSAAVWRIGTTVAVLRAASQNFARCSELASLFKQIAPAISGLPPCRILRAPAPFQRLPAGKLAALGGPVAERRRKPCAVRSSRPMRRNSIRNAMLLSGRPSLPPGNTNARQRIAAICLIIASAAGDSGTRCSLRPFIRSAGIVQSRSPKLISSQRAPMTSPVRAAVSIANSRARAAMPSCSRNSAMKAPISE